MIRDTVFVCLIFAAFWHAANCRRNLQWGAGILPRDAIHHLGAEQDNVARAIRSGRGFADPFNVPSGPTAWTAPVLPLIVSGIYWATHDDRRYVVMCVAIFQAAAVLLTSLVVQSHARGLGWSAAGYVAIITCYLIHFHWLFQRTHDVWLLLLVYDALWLGSTRGWSSSENCCVAAAWGIAGGLMALVSPIAGGAWLAVTAVDRCRPGHSWRPLVRLGAVSALAALLTVSPWTIRNRIALGAWVPIKSNLPFEFWQSQCGDDDGLLDGITLADHPYSVTGTELRQKYVAQGEIDFVQGLGEEARTSVVSSPGNYAMRVTNRLFAALWYYVPNTPEHQPPRFIRMVRLLYPIPCLAVGVLMLVGSRPFRPSTRTCLIVWATVLLPYILISFHVRYAASLAGIQMLLIVHAAGALQATAKSLKRQSNAAANP